MIQNPHILRQFEDDEIRSLAPDLARNLRLLEAMYRQALALGAWEHAADTLPLKLRLAQALNVRTAPAESGG